jgi:outer membrane protein assembly factor BamB
MTRANGGRRRGAGTVSLLGLIVVSLVLAGCDWTTWGGGSERQSYAAFESGIGVGNAASLAQAWSTDLGANIDAAPVVAAAVDVGGTKRDLAYVGTEHGLFAAVDIHDGSIVWFKQYNTKTINCDESPDHIFGIEGAATIDRETNRVYVADVDGLVHALDLGTGTEVSGWPVSITSDADHNFVLGGLDFSQGWLYVGTASHCDLEPYSGQIVSIDTKTARLNHAFNITDGTGRRGGSVWGWGGVSVDPVNGDVFAATGNAVAGAETYGYADHVVRLTRGLTPVASNAPPTAVFDDDFGSTPVLFQRKECPAQLAVMRKDGFLYVYDRDAIANGPRQSIPMSGFPYAFIGVAAYAPDTNTLYVANPIARDPGVFYNGMVAFSVGADCNLSLKWQTQAGPNVALVSSPTVANGVVYFNDGVGNRVRAFDAATGAPLWDSGTTITGNVFTAPVVAQGTLLAAGWDHHLHAFRPAS